MKLTIQYFIIIMSLSSVIYSSDDGDAETVIAEDEYPILAAEDRINFRIAIHNNKIHDVQRLLRDMDPENIFAAVNRKDELNLTPLHHAAYYHNSAMINLLLRNGADPNIADENGDTPLHGIADSKCTECAQALIRAGADLNAENARDRTPVDIAYTPEMQDILNPANYENGRYFRPIKSHK